jgi:heme-degrading monooxygenase HmoA
MAYVNYIDWHTTPFRSERWFEIWRPALDRALAFGASKSYVTRSVDDPLHFRQVSVWESKDDFDRYWASDEVASLRQQALNYFAKPLLPSWHTMISDATPAEPADAAPEAEPANAGAE